MSRKITVYCGWWRDTKVKSNVKIISNIVGEISCLECEGSGIWNHGYDGNKSCTCCKGTGKQYIGL